MIDVLSKDALDYATRRVQGFAQVNVNRSEEERAEAMDTLCESLGFDESMRDRFSSWLDDFIGEGAYDGEVFIGLIVGLFINQYIQER